MLNECGLLTNISLQIGLRPLMAECDTPLITMTKKNLGDDTEKAAFRSFLSLLLVSLPNMIANYIYKVNSVANREDM